MPKRRIPHRAAAHQTGDVQAARYHVELAQAAAWLLDQIHIDALATDATYLNLPESQSPAEIRRGLTIIAVEALTRELDEARVELEAAAAAKAVA